MLRVVTALLDSGPGRRSFARIAASLLVLAVGSGILMSAWAHAIITPRYVPNRDLADLVGRYMRGEAGAVWYVVVLGPIMEEVFARGALLSILLVLYRPVVAIAVSSLIFGVVHGNFVQLVPGLWMGVVLGVVYWRTGSLVLSALGHAAYNAQYWVAHAVLTLPLAGYSSLPPPGAAGDQPWWWLVSGLTLAVGGAVAAVRALVQMPVGDVAVWRRIAPELPHVVPEPPAHVASRTDAG